MHIITGTEVAESVLKAITADISPRATLIALRDVLSDEDIHEEYIADDTLETALDRLSDLIDCLEE